MEKKEEHTGNSPMNQTTGDYDHIELTPEEITAALQFAKMCKARELEEKARKERRRRMREMAMAPWSTEQLRAFVLEKARKLPFRFELDEHNTEVFELLCLYFSDNPEFEKHGFKDPDGNVVQQYSLSKGICLHSVERGTGKTVLMELFSQNKKNCFVVIPSEKIASFFQAQGDEIILRFSAPWFAEQDARFFYQSPIGVCFDDLGDEQEKLHYGNRMNVMYRILTRIYSDDPDKSYFKYFHATTNLTGREIELKYDKRVRSRMREMFNWIVLRGKDRRK